MPFGGAGVKILSFFYSVLPSLSNTHKYLV